MSDRETRMRLLNKSRGIKTKPVPVENLLKRPLTEDEKKYGQAKDGGLVRKEKFEKEEAKKAAAAKKKKKAIVTETHEEINSDTLFESDKSKKKKEEPQELVD